MMRTPVVPEISPSQLDLALQGKQPPVLLDVRESEERDIAVLGADMHIPLMELNSRVNECQKAVENGRELVVYCRSGARSAFAVEFLRESGLIQAKNLVGGINAWSREVDPSIPQY